MSVYHLLLHLLNKPCADCGAPLSENDDEQVVWSQYHGDLICRDCVPCPL